MRGPFAQLAFRVQEHRLGQDDTNRSLTDASIFREASLLASKVLEAGDVGVVPHQSYHAGEGIRVGVEVLD
jgi:hypothetical protein